MAEGQYFYRYEVKGIQPFILATDRLREMQGASALVEQLDDLFKEALRRVGLPDDWLAPPAAGGASLRVDAGDLERLDALMAGWPLVVARHAPGLQVVQARVKAEDDVPALIDAVRVARSRLMAELPEAGPLVMRAPRTGLPAAGLTEEPGSGRTVVVDASTLRKLDAARGTWRTRVDQTLRARGYDGYPEWVTDLSAFKHPYVGVIHADGNDLGRHIQREGSGGLKRFSEALTELTLDAVCHAVEETLFPNRRAKDGCLPARPIIVGGDDVTFIVRGDLALEFTEKLVRRFVEGAREHADAFGAPLTMSAGIALVHKSHPFHLAYELAEGLCRFAKDRCRGKDADGQTASALAFYRLTTASSAAYHDIRKEELSAVGGARLSMCPYTLERTAGFACLEDLNALIEAIDDDKVPGGGLRELLTLQKTDDRQAGHLWQRIGEVMSERGQGEREAWERVVAAMRSLGAVGHWAELPQGERGAPIKVTPLLDALTWTKTMRDRQEGDQ